MEYAFKAANSGLTGVAVRGKDSVCVVTQKKVPDRLMDPSSVSNLFAITPTVGICVTGANPADAKALVQRARYEAGQWTYDHGYSAPAKVIAKRMADLAQVNTQSSGMRPLACISLIISVDEEDGPSIFKVDCAGHYLPFFATAIGTKEQEAVNFLEKKKEEMANYTCDQVIRTAISCLGFVLGSDFKGSELEVACVVAQGTTNNKNKFTLLTEPEIEGHLNAIADDADA
jgi:20S proteasome subunit alpha 1